MHEKKAFGADVEADGAIGRTGAGSPRKAALFGVFVLAAAIMLLFSLVSAVTAAAVQDGAYRPGVNTPDDSTESYRDPHAARNGSGGEGGGSSASSSGRGQPDRSSDAASSEQCDSEEGSSNDSSQDDIGAGRPDGNTDIDPDVNNDGEEGSGCKQRRATATMDEQTSADTWAASIADAVISALDGAGGVVNTADHDG